MRNNYSTAIKSTPFLYLELKKMAELKIESPDLNDKELRNKAVADNIFQVDTIKRRKTIARAVIKRLKFLDNFLIDLLLNGTIETSKQIALYSLLKEERLFFEFMKEVYLEKYLIKDPYLDDKDFNIFFAKKSEQSERVAGWSDYTYYKLKQTFIRILLEAAFIKERDERKIAKPIINREVVDHFKSIREEEILKVMLYEL